MRQATFRISEFAVLDDGTEVTLHADRGLATGGNDPAGIWATTTVEGLTADVLTVHLSARSWP